MPRLELTPAALLINFLSVPLVKVRYPFPPLAFTLLLIMSANLVAVVLSPAAQTSPNLVTKNKPP